MYLVPLLEAAKGKGAGEVTRVAGSEICSLETFAEPWSPWRSGWMVQVDAFDIFVVSGPSSRLVTPRGSTWIVIVALEGSTRVAVSHDDTIVLEPRSMLMLASGATARLEVEEGAVAEVIAAPAQCGRPLISDDDPGATLGGVWWLVRADDLDEALSPRDKVKLAEANLWRPPAPPGPWERGHEIRCHSLSIGVCRTGAPETTHQHERVWEVYQVLEGELNLTIRDARLGPWEPRSVPAGTALLLPPGTGHLVDQTSHHLSVVFQSPPAISDRETVSYRPRNPSLELPFDG